MMAKVIRDDTHSWNEAQHLVIRIGPIPGCPLDNRRLGDAARTQLRDSLSLEMPAIHQVVTIPCLYRLELGSALIRAQWELQHRFLFGHKADQGIVGIMKAA